MIIVKQVASGSFCVPDTDNLFKCYNVAVAVAVTILESQGTAGVLIRWQKLTWI